jgi:hypothetical protein
MNVISKVYFRDFYQLLSDNYDIYRLDTQKLIRINHYDTFLEIFKFQNIVAIIKNLTKNV